jgi:lipopolysaccharide/colanic/teichoic acid biosynthesis glycosyltransferase
MSHKLQIELDYMERRTISSDLRVILETVQALIRQR